MTAVVLVLSGALVACGDDDEGGGSGSGGTSDQSGGTPDRSREFACKVGAKAVEFIGAGLRRGSTARQIINDVGPGLDTGCQAAVTIFVEQPQKSVDLTIVAPGGSTLTEQLTGSALTEEARGSANTGPPNCTNYTIDALFQLCIQLRLAALTSPATP